MTATSARHTGQPSPAQHNHKEYSPRNPHQATSKCSCHNSVKNYTPQHPPQRPRQSGHRHKKPRPPHTYSPSCTRSRRKWPSSAPHAAPSSLPPAATMHQPTAADSDTHPQRPPFPPAARQPPPCGQPSPHSSSPPPQPLPLQPPAPRTPKPPAATPPRGDRNTSPGVISLGRGHGTPGQPLLNLRHVGGPRETPSQLPTQSSHPSPPSPAHTATVRAKRPGPLQPATPQPLRPSALTLGTLQRGSRSFSPTRIPLLHHKL